jgi:hypothetical protein
MAIGHSLPKSYFERRARREQRHYTIAGFSFAGPSTEQISRWVKLLWFWIPALILLVGMLHLAWQIQQAIWPPGSAYYSSVDR